MLASLPWRFWFLKDRENCLHPLPFWVHWNANLNAPRKETPNLMLSPGVKVALGWRQEEHPVTLRSVSSISIVQVSNYHLWKKKEWEEIGGGSGYLPKLGSQLERDLASRYKLENGFWSVQKLKETKAGKLHTLGLMEEKKENKKLSEDWEAKYIGRKSRANNLRRTF